MGLLVMEWFLCLHGTHACSISARYKLRVKLINWIWFIWCFAKLRPIGIRNQVACSKKGFDDDDLTKIMEIFFWVDVRSQPAGWVWQYYVSLNLAKIHSYFMALQLISLVSHPLALTWPLSALKISFLSESMMKTLHYDHFFRMPLFMLVLSANNK